MGNTAREGVATDPDKIEAVAGWPRPNHVPELQSFLGFASYYRCFVEGFAKLAAPLHRLVAQLTGTQAQKSSGGSLHAAWTGVWAELRRAEERVGVNSSPGLSLLFITLHLGG